MSMPAYTYPGVYVKEVDSGIHTITGVATSVTAFVGHCLKGPVDEPIMLTSYADFERTFGGLWLGSYLGYAVRDFYLNGGSQALVVRVLSDKAASATTTITINSTNANSNSGSPTGNGGSSTESSGSSSTGSGSATGSSGSSSTGSGSSGSTLTNITLTASNEGSWGNNLTVTIKSYLPTDTIVNSAIKQYGFNSTKNLFGLTVSYAGSKGILESFDYLTLDQTSAQSIDKVLANKSQYIKVSSIKDAASTATLSIFPVQFSNGNDGSPETASTNTDSTNIIGDQAKKTGIYALEKADIFNLLYIPPYQVTDGSLPGRVGNTVDVARSVLTEAATYCNSKKAFLLIDPPSSWKQAADVSLNNLINDLSNNTDHAAVFFPRIKQANPLRNNQIEEFLPGGMIAGTFARIDAQRGIWKAPAGLEAGLTGAMQLSVPLTDGENGNLNPAGVNCLRTMPAVGNVIWGARTLAGDDRLGSQWKYIPVRRLALYLEQSLYRGTQWVVFEPNDESLWRQIRLNIGSFMDTLFRQGAFQGQSAKEAYFVKCDSTTTTQNDIDNGIVNIIIGFAPLKPAEFVVIQIQQTTGQN